jgi:hypothetical protein
MAPRVVSPNRPANRVEILIGRSLAVSAHPALAWRLLPFPKRALLVFGYFAASFVTVLGALQLLGR